VSAIRFGNIFRLFTFVTILFTVASCIPMQRNTPDPTHAVQAIHTPIETDNKNIPPSALMLSPTDTPLPISKPAALNLGQPSWVGRGRVVNAVFLPDAKQIALAWGCGVSLYSVESAEELWYQSTPTDLIAFDVNPQGRVFAAALADSSIMIFDAANGTSRLYGALRPNAYWGDIAWSPDGHTLAYQFNGPGRTDPISLLDLDSGQVREVPNSSTGEGVTPALTWSPDGASMTVAALGNVCPRLIDVQTGAGRMQLGRPGHCYAASPLFLPDGKRLADIDPSSGVVLMDFPESKQTKTLQRTDGHLLGQMLSFPDAGGALFIDLGQKWIATRGGYEPCYCGNPADLADHPLIVWNLESGSVQAQLKRPSKTLATRHRLAATFDPKRSDDRSDDRILMFYESGEITQWNFGDPQAEEQMVSRLPVRPIAAYTLIWSADGSHLAFTGDYGGVDVYQTSTGQLVRRFDTPLGSPSLSPDGRLAALFDPEKQVEAVYRVRDGSLLRTQSASPVLMGAAFSPDGQYLAYGAGTSAAIVELASGKVTRLDPTNSIPMPGDMSITRLVWSPDGQALATIFGSTGSGGVGLGVIVLWKHSANDSFTALYHVANVQASYDTPNLTLAAFNPSSSRVVLQDMPAMETAQPGLIVYDLQANRVTQTFPEYRIGAWINDEELLAAEAQYYTRLTRINVVSGDKTLTGSRDIGDTVYAPGGLFTAQMAQPEGRGISISDWKSGKIVVQASHQGLNLTGCFWSPDGHWLASTMDDGTLRIWPVMIH
jgi:WD40 repeat protein